MNTSMKNIDTSLGVVFFICVNAIKYIYKLESLTLCLRYIERHEMLIEINSKDRV